VIASFTDFNTFHFLNALTDEFEVIDKGNSTLIKLHISGVSEIPFRKNPDFKYELKIGDVLFVTNIEQEYDGKVCSPFEAKGSFKATISRGILQTLLMDNPEFEKYGLRAFDSIGIMCVRLFKQGITQVEIFKEKYVFHVRIPGQTTFVTPVQKVTPNINEI